MSDGLLDSLLHTQGSVRHAEPDWLARTREVAAHQARAAGLPDARNEAWKYTSLRALSRRSFAIPAHDARDDAFDLAALDLPEIHGARLTFVNGVFRDDLSSVPEIAGLILQPLSTVLASDANALRPVFDGNQAKPVHLFAEVNAAAAAEGVILRVADGADIVEPVHLLFVGRQASSDIVWQMRSLVELGPGSSLRLVEHHIGDDRNANLGNCHTRYTLGEGARLELTQIQNAGPASSLIRRSAASLARDAVLSANALDIGAQLSRHDLTVDLGGARARFESRGTFALRGRQHGDAHLDVRHHGIDTGSDIFWRGVADQRARGVFHGAITIAAGADGSDARLSNKNLLLSDQAEIDTQPVLEIYADEVMASHGATVGQLDENALFYLRSRGLDEKAARQILTVAFCESALAGVAPRGVREYMSRLLTRQLLLQPDTAP